MSVEIGLYEAKSKFSQVVEHVAASGEDVVLTKRGKPVARIVPIEPGESAVEKVFSELLGMKGLIAPGEESVRDLIDHGRRM